MVNLIMPRGLTFVMEGHVNLTIPNFNSMLVDVRITERSKRMYELDLAGTWFSGHNMTARGTYSDRSIATIVSHSLKLILKSPSFANDFLINCKVYQNYSDVRIDLHVEQLEQDKYAFILNHTVVTPTNIVSYVEGRYKGNVYSVMTEIDTRREIRMEIHLDKWRDVHLILSGINEKNKKRFGAEVKWDANRDPALKLAFFFSLDHQTAQLPALSSSEEQLAERNVSTMVTLTYPGRFVVCSCHVTARRYYDYIVDAAIDWNPEETIKLFVATEYNIKPWIKSVSLDTRLLMPFENWKNTALSVRYEQERNRVKLDGSAHWRDSQKLIAELEGIVAEHDNVKEWKANCGISSTVHDISSTTVNVTHKIIHSETADTRLLIKYHPDRVIDAWSVWYLDKESDDIFNLTGNLHLESPVTRYKVTDLRCQLQVLPDSKFFGATNLNLDKKTYTGKLIGDLRRLRESMVEFNVTTPLEKFAFARGRFGFSESNRHVVAEVLTPENSIGFEVLYQFFTPCHDFNVRLLLATPLEILQKLLLIAKLNDREADFRVGYNRIMAGFQGVWRYRNITDFHYSYMLFTPLEGFEETGIVTKLILTRTEDDCLDVDTEFSVRVSDEKFSDMKLGVRARAGSKPAPITIPIKSPIVTADQTKLDDTELTTERNELDQLSEDYDEPSSLHWYGEIEIYPVIVEPIKGELDVDSDGPTYKIAGGLQYLQKKKILLEDTFWMEDLFNMKNELNLIVPFELFNEIVCSNAFIMNMETLNYKMEAVVNVRRNATWYETGLVATYIYHESEVDDSQLHVLHLNVKTPIDSLKFINTNTSLDIDENFYRAKVGIRAPDSVIDLFGSLETEETLLDTVLTVEVNTPLLKVPRSTVTAKRDFTAKEKYAKIGCDIAEPVGLSLQSSWYAKDDKMKAFLVFKSWIESMRNVEVQASYSNAIASNGTASLNVLARHQLDRQYKLLGNYSDRVIKAELYTPRSNGKPHFEYHGTVMKESDTLHRFNGELRNRVNSSVHAVSGVVELTENGTLRAFEATARPKGAEIGEEDDLVLKLKREKYGLNAALIGRTVNGSLDANFVNLLNWDVRARANLPNQNEDAVIRFVSFMNVQVNDNTTLYVHAETPLPDVRNVTFVGSVLTSNNSGDIRANGWLNEHARQVILQWRFVYMADMFGRALIGSEGPNLDSKLFDGRLFFKNPRRAFRNVDVGFDLDVDREKWKFGANATVGFRNHENIDGVFAVRLPPPNNDDHRVLISYHANQGMKDASYVVGYNALRAKTNYASDGSIHMGTRDINGHLRASWGMLPVQSVNNLLNISFDNKEVELKYSLYTPKFQQQETLVLLFNYDGTQDMEKRLINAEVYYPASTRIASANVSYESLLNVNGTINTALPVANVSSLGCQFIVLTTLQRNKRYAKLYWPRNTAIVNSDYNYQSENLNSDLEGILHAEVPLNTRHIGHLTYGYKKRPQTTTGYAKLTYNGQKVLHGQYNSKSESRAGFEKDRTQITVENMYKPIGILYVNQYEYSAGNAGTNLPTVEFKQVNLYRLDNRTALNVTGESRIKTTHTGQDIHLKAIHLNKTLQLRTEYEVLPGEFDQTSWLSLAEDAWVSYSVNILNKTTEEVGNQFLVLNVSYPRRNFSLDGSYWISSEELKSAVKLDWDRETARPRTIGALFNWTKLSSEGNGMHHRAIFALIHPSFLKETSLTGEIKTGSFRDSVNVRLVADYSTDPSKLFEFSASYRNESEPPIFKKHSYKIAGNHPSTRFDLDVRGFVYERNSSLFEMVNNGRYNRRFTTRDAGKLNARLDLNRDELLFQREYNDAVKYLNVRYYSFDRKYVVNGSVINTPGLNATGAFFFHPTEKLTWMMLNYTPG